MGQRKKMYRHKRPMLKFKLEEIALKVITDLNNAGCTNLNQAKKKDDEGKKYIHVTGLYQQKDTGNLEDVAEKYHYYIINKSTSGELDIKIPSPFMKR